MGFGWYLYAMEFVFREEAMVETMDRETHSNIKYLCCGDATGIAHARCRILVITAWLQSARGILDTYSYLDDQWPEPHLEVSVLSFSEWLGHSTEWLIENCVFNQKCYIARAHDSYLIIQVQVHKGTNSLALSLWFSTTVSAKEKNSRRVNKQFLLQENKQSKTTTWRLHVTYSMTWNCQTYL